MDKQYGVDLDGLNRLSRELALNHQEEIPADYWHGYLCALALSPMAVPEAEWMGPVVHRESSEDTAELEQDLRDVLGGIIDSLRDRQFTPYFPGDDADWRSCQPGAWCEGFLTASRLWPEDLQGLAGEELVALTLPVIIFYDPQEYFSNHGAHLSENEREQLMDQSFQFFRHGLYEIPGLWSEVLQQVESAGGDDEDS